MDTENYIFFAKLSWGKSYDIQFANFHHSKFSSLAKAQELAILFHTSDLERSRTSRNCLFTEPRAGKSELQPIPFS